MEIRSGMIASLIGPNGAGKTTVFNCITGFTRADTGNIIFRNAHKDHDLGALSPDKIVALGLARTFQNLRLFHDLSVFDHIKLGYFLRSKNLFKIIAADRKAERTAWELIEFIGLKDVWKEKPGTLPFGYQRRLELARALATMPEILLLDEPAAGLNSSESEELMRLIEKIKERSIAVLLIEHDMNVVMRISDQITVLDYGVKIAEGKPEEIKADPRVIDVYLGQGQD